MAELSTEKCTSIRKDSPQLSNDQIAALQPQIPGWPIVVRDGIPRLERVFRVTNFDEALAFANKVGDLARHENHHPAILIEWGRVTVAWWTHAIGGLHRNDFIMAAKTDALFDTGHPETH